ncbi:hypothetical protein BDV38DRAFT_278440 [Aspergillus pseudotamarii]|uniref:Uncharacterized protein n=1 Tax=Aspergillus pseudotamarii TaxID=132259 RepID=A0A5N6T7K3_ASPPS|nr:uncharacterized protein BDV38DRAFT_278440 [Aspergillus pseudotamarii]KAE8142272.1 hypothetical protein BDV38DRAFT_278440 [Aspergillus pseudotamarii]
MESLLRRKGTSMNRRGSISQLLHIQKPTFSLLQEQPTRYYDLVDSHGYNEPSSPSTHCQYISPELESDIRYACSLLVYRIERGVPSPPANQSSNPSTRLGSEKRDHSSAAQEGTVPQIDSKYFSPKVGAEVAAMKDKLDSGVGLTQQPSRQTMRLLKSSHSDARSDSDERTSGSLCSQVRSTTSGSDTSNAEESNSQSPVKDSPQDEKQNMMGSSIRDAQTKDQDTMSFLAGTCNSGLTSNEALEDMEVFLNPDVGLDSDGIPSFTSPSTFLDSTSPSFGVSSGLTQSGQPGPITQSRFLGDRPGTMAGLDRSQSGQSENEPGVIIDGNGVARVLTAAEEAQRNLNLQQAVMAKMKSNVVESSTNALPQTPKQAFLHKNPQSEHQPIPSRLETSCSHKSKATTPNWKSHTETISPSNNKPTLFQKITGLFKKRRAPDQCKPCSGGTAL